MNRRLGRKAIKTDSRTLRLARYLTAELPPPPAARDWTKGIAEWGMMGNDTLGDCTIAGCGHAIQVWTANLSGEATVLDSAILQAYEAWDGYNPNDPSTDRGGIELDVLTDWKANPLAGHALLGFADPNVSNLQEIRQAINLFGGVYIGVSLPLTAQHQDIWDVAPDPGDGSTQAGSWGGHCVFVCAYDAEGFTCITWGRLKKLTISFWSAYVDEAHALLSSDWIAVTAPSGFDLQQLESDLALIQ